ncbi:MAG: neutral zinc metallopeptidase [Actinomycetota bacterium]|nr:neutral zinc metallopeptidase [Actinomycetota bacterium]
MPIGFDDQSVDVSGVDDRRGAGGGLAIGGGAGVVGLVIYLIVAALGGGPQSLQGLGGGGAGAVSGGRTSGEPASALERRCNTAGALERDTDCRLIKTFTVADTVWEGDFARRGRSYVSPRFVLFSGSARTGCGTASADVGPFYCPPDQKIFFDLDFLEELQTRFGANGQFAQAYIVAHEFGHHLQTILGTEAKVRGAAQRVPAQANTLSVRLELQADCYAGVWAALADASETNGIELTEDNIAEAVGAAQAVGDDRIQAKTSGRVDPESWTHGSAAQRKQWFLTGFRSADTDSCTTFTP